MVFVLAVGLLIGYIIRKNVGEKAIGSAETKARNLILDAENRAETIKKEITLEAKEDAHRLRSEAEREVRERRSEIQKSIKYNLYTSAPFFYYIISWNLVTNFQPFITLYILAAVAA